MVPNGEGAGRKVANMGGLRICAMDCRTHHHHMTVTTARQALTHKERVVKNFTNYQRRNNEQRTSFRISVRQSNREGRQTVVRQTGKQAGTLAGTQTGDYTSRQSNLHRTWTCPLRQGDSCPLWSL